MFISPSPNLSEFFSVLPSALLFFGPLDVNQSCYVSVLMLLLSFLMMVLYSAKGCSDFNNSMIRIAEKVQNKILSSAFKKAFFDILLHSLRILLQSFQKYKLG